MAYADLFSREGGTVPLTSGVGDPAARRDLKRLADLGLEYETSISNIEADVTSLETSVDALPKGHIATNTITTSVSGIGAGPTTVLTVVFDALAGRRYKLSSEGHLAIAVAGNRFQFAIYDPAAIQLNRFSAIATASGGFFDGHVEADVVPGAGSKTYTVRVSRLAGAGTADFLAGATSPAWLRVEDIGV